MYNLSKIGVHYRYWGNEEICQQHLVNVKNKKQSGSFEIDYTKKDFSVFHVGKTSVTYYRDAGFYVYAIGINSKGETDGFWDVNFWKENSDIKHGINISDREGPNYELGGTPYPYMPYVFIIPY